MRHSPQLQKSSHIFSGKCRRQNPSAPGCFREIEVAICDCLWNPKIACSTVENPSRLVILQAVNVFHSGLLRCQIHFHGKLESEILERRLRHLQIHIRGNPLPSKQSFHIQVGRHIRQRRLARNVSCSIYLSGQDCCRSRAPPL